MNKKRVITIGIIVILAVAITVKLASNKKHIEEKKQPVTTSDLAIPVNVAVATYNEVNDQLVKSGNLIPYKEADITAVSSGKLVAVNFSLGTKTTQGAVLAVVDTRGVELSLESARLTKSKAEKDFKRYKALLEGEAATEVSFQDAKLNYENAANQIEQLEKQLSDNRIKAPINGQVTAKVKEVGEYVNLGAVLGHMVDVSRLKVNVMVAEKDAYTLQVGTSVNVTTDIYPGVNFEGKITFISSKGDATHNYQVEIELQNKSDHPLKAGTFVYTDFSRRSQQKLMMIPRSALVESLKNPFVYVVENGKAVARKIAVGRDIDDQIEVLSGLKEGDQVISGGQINIAEGKKVKVVK
jgi:RND family efflux transporter MFP subunit